MMGEGLGGGDRPQFGHNHLMRTIQFSQYLVHPSDGVFLHVSVSIAGGITPSQPSPIKGEGFEAAPCSMRGGQR